MNSRSEVLAGLGRAWLTDDIWIQQIGSDADGWKTVASNGEVLDEQGFNRLSAGGGKLSTWLHGRGPKGNFGPLDPAGVVLDIGLDGTVVWCASYQDGSPVGIYGRELFPIVPLSARACGLEHFVCALSDGRIWSNRLGFAAIPAGVVPFRPYLIGETLLYHTHEWLVLQRFDEPVGVVVAAKPAYSPDMTRVSGGYLVAWCLNEGETEVREARISDVGLTEDLRGLRDVPDPEPDPEPEPEPSMPVPDVESFVRDFIGPRLRRLGSEDATREVSFEAVNACCVELRKTDEKWGVLEKTSGDRVRDRAADILLYRLSATDAQVVDVVSDAEGHDGPPAPGWSVKDIRPISQWKLPYGAAEPDPEPDPDPDPEPDPQVPENVTARLAALEGRMRRLEAWTRGV